MAKDSVNKQGFGSQGFGSQGFGTQKFGTQVFGTQVFGTQGFGGAVPESEEEKHEAEELEFDELEFDEEGFDELEFDEEGFDEIEFEEEAEEEEAEEEETGKTTPKKKAGKPMKRTGAKSVLVPVVKGKTPRELVEYTSRKKLSKTAVSEYWALFGGDKLATYDKAEGTAYIVISEKYPTYNNGPFINVTQKLVRKEAGNGYIECVLQIGKKPQVKRAMERV